MNTKDGKNNTPTWDEIENKHKMWVEDRETFCMNMADPLNETEYLMEDLRILSALLKAISEDFELYWEE